MEELTFDQVVFPPDLHRDKHYLTVLEDFLKQVKIFPKYNFPTTELEADVVAGNNWLSEVNEIFSKNTFICLMNAISPRVSSTSVIIRPDKDLFSKLIREKYGFDFVTRVIFKSLAENELNRFDNSAKSKDFRFLDEICACESPPRGFMMKCELCRDWFHSLCSTLPYLATVDFEENVRAMILRLGYDRCKFLCTKCCRTKRPNLNIVQQFIDALKELPVRIPEGEALVNLALRCSSWQERVQNFFNIAEVMVAETEMAKRCTNDPEIPEASTWGVYKLSDTVAQQLRLLKMEGDLLEISFDQDQERNRLWRMGIFTKDFIELDYHLIHGREAMDARDCKRRRRDIRNNLEGCRIINEHPIIIDDDDDDEVFGSVSDTE